MALRIQVVRREVPNGQHRRRRWTVVAATIVATVLVTGVSYAFWTVTGSGSATVGSVKIQTLSILSSSPVVADLYPNKPTEALNLVISNPNPFAMNSIVLSLGTFTSSDETNCPAASNLTVPAGPFTLTGLIVPAASGGTPATIAATIPNFVQMKQTALNACQNLTFTFPFTLTGQQQ